jgi:hypothetical protein
VNKKVENNIPPPTKYVTRVLFNINIPEKIHPTINNATEKINTAKLLPSISSSFL